MYQPRPPRMPFNQTYRMQHRNPNFVPRGRGPRYGYNNYNSMYRGPPPPPPPIQSRCENYNEDYWCETCDRGFPTQKKLEFHKQQHQKCNIDGCQFIAHPKVITKHIQMQHSTGLFKKIANLNKPEDIQKWREERKRRFPTKENVEKKAAEIKEKIERGEKIGLQKNRNFNNDHNQKRMYPYGNKTYDNKRKKNENQGNTNNSNRRHNKKPKKQLPLPPPESNRKLKPFAGIQDLVVNDVEIKEEIDHDFDDQIEDDDDCLPEIKQFETSFKTEEPVVCGALSTLMCEYGTSDEENEIQAQQNESAASENVKKTLEAKTEEIDNVNNSTKTLDKEGTLISNVNISTIKQETEERNPVAAIKYESDDEAPPEEVKVEKPIASIDDAKYTKEKNNMNKRTKNRNEFQHKKPKMNYKQKLPSTLLQKLLHREIQQERNIVLQCIRHIVMNNYFDK